MIIDLDYRPGAWPGLKFIQLEFVSYLGERGVLCVGNVDISVLTSPYEHVQ